MDISGVYYAVQEMEVGTLAQLVYGEENVVSKVFEVAQYSETVVSKPGFKAFGVSGVGLNIVYVYEVSPGILEIDADYGGTKWIRTIRCGTPVECELIVTPTALYLQIYCDSDVIIPGMQVIKGSKDTKRWIIIKINSGGTAVAFTVVNYAQTVNMVYDVKTENISLYGVSNNLLKFNTGTLVSTSGNFSYIVALSTLMVPVLKTYKQNYDLIYLDSRNANLLLADKINGIVRLSYIESNKNIPTWVADYGLSELLDVNQFDNFIAFVGKDAESGNYVSYVINNFNQLLSSSTISTSGTITMGALGYKDYKLLFVYMSEDENGIHMSEYDVFSDYEIWSYTLDITKPYQIGAAFGRIVIYSNDKFEFYIKRYPSLIGVVSQVLYPCPEGQTGCWCDQPADCCENNDNCPPGLQNVLKNLKSYQNNNKNNKCVSNQEEVECRDVTNPNGDADAQPSRKNPRIVKVDFVMTKAYKNLVPGAEYYINSVGEITTNTMNTKLIGTALDKQRLLLSSTIYPSR